MLDGVGDLQFAAGAGLDGLDAGEHGGSEQVHAHERQVALWFGRLLDQALDGAVGELGDAVLTRVGNLLQQDEGIRRTLREAAHERRDALLEEVVAEELLGDEYGVREAEGRRLGDVGDLQTEAAAVADGSLDLGSRVADHQADFGDAGLAHGLEAVEEHRLVGDRHELLGGGVGNGPQTSAGSAAEDESSHRRLPPLGPRWTRRLRARRHRRWR